jgi:transcriptional antiterminator RfaH
LFKSLHVVTRFCDFHWQSPVLFVKMSTKESINWYIVYTRPKFEKKVMNELCKKEIEVFLPLRTIVSQWSDRSKKLEIPLFSNYVFVKISFGDRFKVLDVPGIVRFVTTAKNPDTISQSDVDLIKKLLTYSKEISTNEFSQGDLCKIVKGPFIGHLAILTEIKGRFKTSVLIESINKAVKVDIPVDCLQRV